MALMLAITVLVAAVTIGALRLAKAMEAGADHPFDARSKVVRRGDACRIVVTNPAPGTIIVGLRMRHVRVASLSKLFPDLVIRPVQWSERRRADRGADLVLGAVEGRSAQEWRIDVPSTAVRVALVLSQPAGRLRVHDHLLAPWTRLRSSAG